MSEQATSLLKIANTIHSKLIKKVGVRIDGEPNEKFELYHSYDVDKCKKIDDIWDIPQYCNGTTRHAQCIFLLPYMGVGDACYPYLVKDTVEVEERFKDDKYDREKVLIQEYFGENFVEIVWSYDFKQPSGHGTYWYSVEKFWFAVRVNGEIVNKHEKIDKLIIPFYKK